jgi:hypothetical protein
VLEATVDASDIVLGAAEPTLSTRPATSPSAAAGDWLCAWCHTRVANERDRFSIDGKDEFAFTNPEGIRFEILTFAEAPGCHQTGIPTLEHTWFPGYAWSFCHCDECGQHLGWHYLGKTDFVGLIKTRIVRALHVRN